jgi:hypothetical protein
MLKIVFLILLLQAGSIRVLFLILTCEIYATRAPNNGGGHENQKYLPVTLPSFLGGFRKNRYALRRVTKRQGSAKNLLKNGRGFSEKNSSFLNGISQIRDLLTLVSFFSTLLKRLSYFFVILKQKFFFSITV